MIIEYTDQKNWKYTFTLDEEDLLFFQLNCWTETGVHIHTEDVPFCDDVFGWRHYHTRKDNPLISPEAIQYCEKSVRSYMKLKAFW